MNITSLTVYLVMQMDSIKVGLIMLTTVSFVVLLSAASYLLGGDILEDYEKFAKKTLKWTLPTTIILAVCVAILPSSKTLAAMYMLPKIANSEVVQGEMNEFYELAKEGLKSLIGENNNKERN